MKKQTRKEKDAQIKSQNFSTAYYVQDAASDTTTWTNGQACFSHRTKTVTQVTH